MRERELKEWLSGLDRLTLAQRQQLRQRLDMAASRDELAAALQRRVCSHPGCPHCSSLSVVRNGHADGLQRYKCRACRCSFNLLTGTPLARLRQRDKWAAQAQVLQWGLSVRKAAQHLSVHRTTAFRWRHRFLCLPRTIKAQSLQGVAEADETYELRSFKGQPRRLALHLRPARKRGGHAAKRGLSDEQIPVLVVRNRSGATTNFVLPHNDRPSRSRPSRLASDGQILPEAARGAALLWAFGTLIGNTDMHPGNLSFVSEYGRPYALAPAYDMAPMAFAPRSGGGLPDTLQDANIAADVSNETWRNAESLAWKLMARLTTEPGFSPRFRPCLSALEHHIAMASTKIARLG